MAIEDLSGAEYEVMEHIWSAKETVTINDILAFVKDKWVYQTVETFINRLHEKGYIEMVGKRGRSFLYAPRITRAEHIAFTKGHMISEAPGSTVTDLIRCLYANGIIHDSDVNQLAEWVKEVRN